MTTIADGSFTDANPMQRSRQAVVNPGISCEVSGRTLLGVEEQITALT